MEKTGLNLKWYGERGIRSRKPRPLTEESLKISAPSSILFMQLGPNDLVSTECGYLQGLAGEDWPGKYARRRINRVGGFKPKCGYRVLKHCQIFIVMNFLCIGTIVFICHLCWAICIDIFRWLNTAEWKGSILHWLVIICGTWTYLSVQRFPQRQRRVHLLDFTSDKFECVSSRWMLPGCQMVHLIIFPEDRLIS